MMSLWWLALPVLLLPIWWHRQKSERTNTEPLATARFLPRTDPLQQRVWRWRDRVLLLVRLLLLAAVIAWLADLVLPWRSDSVLLVPGTDKAWAAQQIRATGFDKARQVDLPGPDAFAWLAAHEREWRPNARILLLGAVAMPALKPRLAHQVVLVTQPAPVPKGDAAVTVVSARPALWRALFAAVGGPRRFVAGTQPNPKAELIVWDVPEAPPGGMRAPLWWVGDASAFPELKNAPAVDGMRYADSPRGRLWTSAAWPPADAPAARKLFETWQQLHYPPVAWSAPSQVLAASPGAPQAFASGALHYLLAFALAVLFALERLLSHVAHARRR
jgi:hypothetical protein